MPRLLHGILYVCTWQKRSCNNVTFDTRFVSRNNIHAIYSQWSGFHAYTDIPESKFFFDRSARSYRSILLFRGLSFSLFLLLCRVRAKCAVNKSIICSSIILGRETLFRHHRNSFYRLRRVPETIVRSREEKSTIATRRTEIHRAWNTCSRRRYARGD